MNTSVWRVLGATSNNTRPLGFCDPTSFDKTDDLEPLDVIFQDKIDEGIRSYHSPKHKWYWLSDQQEDEVFVFRTSASEGFDLPCMLG